MQATARLTFSYVAPGNVATQSQISQTIEYVGSAAGFIDVPEGTLDDVSYTIPLGSISGVKMAVIQNNTAHNLEVAVNGSEDVFILPPGGVCMPSCGTAAGITSLAVTTTVTQDADGSVSYIVLGDTATP